jgi:hypothetical protein
VTVDTAEDARQVSRPLAVLEDRETTRVFVWGTPAEVAAKTAKLGGLVEEGHQWPSDPVDEFCWSLRVPPALTGEAVNRLPVGWNFVALHGVGELRAASGAMEGASDLRDWAEAVGGHLVVTQAPASGLGGFDPWGKLPPAIEIQRRLIAEFDPVRVINPGRLPGGL